MLIKAGRNFGLSAAGAVAVGVLAGAGVAVVTTVCPKSKSTVANKTSIDKTSKRMADYASGMPPVCKGNLQKRN